MTGSGGLVSARQGDALVLTIDRPQAKNALDRESAQQLLQAVLQAAQDLSLRALVLTGAGSEVFVSGGDLRDFAQLVDAPDGAEQVLAMGQALSALEACPLPVLAAVQGRAFGGGCELLLACDLVVLEAHSSLSFRQAAMGLSTGWGGGTRLLERVGALRASQLLLFGQSVEPSRALELGLVNEVVPQGQSLSRALQLVAQLGALSRTAVSGLKQMLWQVRQAQRADALQREAQVFSSLWAGEAHRSAMQAFFARKA